MWQPLLKWDYAKSKYTGSILKCPVIKGLAARTAESVLSMTWPTLEASFPGQQTWFSEAPGFHISWTPRQEQLTLSNAPENFKRRTSLSQKLTPGQSTGAQVRERMGGAKVQGHIKKESVTTGSLRHSHRKGGTAPRRQAEGEAEEATMAKHYRYL